MSDRASINPDHTVYSNDPYFESLGLSMFSAESLLDFCEAQAKDLPFVEYLSVNSSEVPEPEELYNSIMGVDNHPSILHWNEETRQYENKELSEYGSITAFQAIDTIGAIEANRIFLNDKYKERTDDTNFYSSVNFSPDVNEEFIREVKISSSGCITWNPSLFYNVNGQSIPISPRLCLYLQDPFVNSNKRVIATKEPYISAIPTTVGGTPYGAKITSDYKGQDGFPSIRPPVGGEDNPENKRAGKLDIHYNPNTGKYESGSRQCFAVLLSDLPAVTAPDVDVTNFQDASIDSFYGLNGQFNQVGDWTKETHIGSGIVLNVQKANPYLFGPNFISRWKEKISEEFSNININEKELVQVIQRTKASFAVGELVLLSNIDGEWIPLKIAEGVAGSSFSFGVNNWSFTKVISDSDSYFKDARVYQNAISGSGDQVDIPLSATIDPETYEITMRGKFYKELYDQGSQDSATINFQPLLSVEDSISSVNQFLSTETNWNFEPSSRYWQVTAFDQAGSFLGGTNQKNIIARTSWSNPPSIEPDEEDTPPPEDFVEWWGPAFGGGYDVAQVQALLSKRSSVSLMGHGQGSSEFFFLPGENGFDGTPSQPAFVDVGDGLDRNWSLSYESPNGMFGNPTDRRASNLPAEIAMNTSPNDDGYGSPLEDLRILFENYGCDTSILEGTRNIFGIDASTDQQVRFNWVYEENNELENSGIFNPAFNLRPNSINIIDFFPLHGEAVSSPDYENGDYGKEYRNEDLAFGYLNRANFPNHMFGGDEWFDRNKHCDVDHFTVDGVGPIIPYDEYTTNKSPQGSRNVLEIWEDDSNSPRADCVGVISAKANISFRGNELRFVADQQLGIRLINTTFQGQGTINSGGIGGLPTFGPGLTFSSTDIRWGGGSDRPQDFNTTALHVKVFDAWPNNQTIYDPRYFGVFHFNPGEILSDVETDSTTLINSGEPNQYNPDKITTSVDFRVPTNTENKLVDFGIIDSGVTFAEQKYWKVDPIRRGMMLAQGGFRYRKRVSGISVDSIDIRNAGTGYLVGDILNVTGNGRNVVISVTSVGTGGELQADGLEYLSIGEGFNPQSFLDDKVKIFGGTGSDADIVYRNCFVYEQILQDSGPTNHSAPHLRLSDPSSRGQGNRGNGDVTGVAERSLVISDPNSSNEYDLFFHFHNDITHTTLTEQDDIVFPPQRLSLEIGAI